MKFSEIEWWIDNNEQLYQWMRTWCKNNRKNSNKFIKVNYNELVTFIKSAIKY